jgi:hypothetical protein
MKKLFFAVASTALLGLASMSAPAIAIAGAGIQHRHHQQY